MLKDFERPQIISSISMRPIIKLKKSVRSSQVTGLEQANSISNPTTQTATRSDIDIASEFINLIQERLSYEANAKVINVADNLVGSLLDIKA